MLIETSKQTRKVAKPLYSSHLRRFDHLLLILRESRLSLKRLVERQRNCLKIRSPHYLPTEESLDIYRLDHFVEESVESRI